MSRSVDKFLEEVKEKQDKATEIFKKMYTEEEQEQKEKVLDELLYQIEVCEGFCRPVTEKQIREWLTCENEIQVSRKAKAHKFAA